MVFLLGNKHVFVNAHFVLVHSRQLLRQLLG